MSKKQFLKKFICFDYLLSINGVESEAGAGAASFLRPRAGA
jgi:hypothetical protein